jgi:F-type H+-transporting ATPase subunit epsilon
VKPFRLLILTPEGEAFSGDVEALEVPTLDGHIGILADHATMVAGLARGVLQAACQDGRRRSWTVEEGFIQIYRNEAAVLTPRATSQ